MSDMGIVLRDAGIHFPPNIKRMNIPVLVQDGWALPWRRVAFISASINVPWDLLPPGFEFLHRWEVAAPIWRYDILASDVARGEDRFRTEGLVHDLRILLYAHELLFVRDCENAHTLLDVWQREMRAVPGGDMRLAFVRALYIVKPLVLALPNSWLARPSQGRRVNSLAHAGAMPLTRVEVMPGRFVRCRIGDEEAVRAEFAKRQKRRRQNG